MITRSKGPYSISICWYTCPSTRGQLALARNAERELVDGDLDAVGIDARELDHHRQLMRLVREKAVDAPAMIALRAGVPLVVQALMVLLAGKTVGELVVDLRTSPASYARRLVKLLVGVVPLVTLAVITVPAAQVALAALAVAAVVGAFLTRGHRGLSNAVARLELDIDDS